VLDVLRFPLAKPRNCKASKRSPQHPPNRNTNKTGTIDALLCSKDGVSNATALFSEAARVLAPGGTFLLVSLGDPARRLCLLRGGRFDWAVSVVLLPKLGSDQQARGADGRPVNDSNAPLDYLGPFEADAAGNLGKVFRVRWSRCLLLCARQTILLP
jgi:SAM-dependent methyltransferase